MYYGQFETDKVIEEYFPNKKYGTCIEVGAYDGIKGSNTKYFDDLGWYSICIEPNPLIYKQLAKNRQFTLNYACVGPNNLKNQLKIITLRSGIESSLTALELDNRLIQDYGKDIVHVRPVEVNCITLDEIISVLELKFVDFISIDTEGTELDVLHGLDLTKTRPKLLIIENNYEDLSIRDYMDKFGYKLDRRYKINDFFVVS